MLLNPQVYSRKSLPKHYYWLNNQLWKHVSAVFTCIILLLLPVHFSHWWRTQLTYILRDCIIDWNISVGLLTLFCQDIIIVEALKLDNVKNGLYMLHCLPLRLVGAEGSPIRCILIKWSLRICSCWRLQCIVPADATSLLLYWCTIHLCKNKMSRVIYISLYCQISNENLALLQIS
jgi:hypothetical protein